MRGPLMVGLDGSEKDARAIAVAKAIARLSGRPIHLVRVVEDPGLAGSLPAPTDHSTTQAVIRGGDAAASLITHAVDRDALLIVMGTRAAGAGMRAIVGSVADRVMRESPRPVVLVPPGAAFLAGKEPRIKRVLVPLDGSSLAFRSIELLIELPHATELEYVLIEVVAKEDARATAEARLRTTAAWLRSRGVTTVEEVVAAAPDPAAAIVDAVRDFLPDCIVMSTRGAGGLGRLVFGSVAEGVVRRSELPVMLLTPRALG